MGNNGTTSKVQVLYVGNEILLSKATAELLKSAGYKVRTTTPLHAVNTIKDDRFAVVILCATLSGEEADEIVEKVAVTQPETPILSVHLGLLGDAPNPRSTVVVDALKGPEALVSAVRTAVRVPSRAAERAS